MQPTSLVQVLEVPNVDRSICGGQVPALSQEKTEETKGLGGSYFVTNVCPSGDFLLLFHLGCSTFCTQWTKKMCMSVEL